MKHKIYYTQYKNSVVVGKVVDSGMWVIFVRFVRTFHRGVSQAQNIKYKIYYTQYKYYFVFV